MLVLDLAATCDVPPDLHGLPAARRACERAAHLIVAANADVMHQAVAVRTRRADGVWLVCPPSSELGALQRRVLDALAVSLSGPHLQAFEELTAGARSVLPELPAKAAGGASSSGTNMPPPAPAPPTPVAEPLGSNEAPHLVAQAVLADEVSLGPPAIGVPVGRRLLDLSESFAARFLPAMVALQLWLFVALTDARFGAGVAGYWPMGLAMLGGALLGGSSTPMGGGAVAFPVALFALPLSPREARDVAVLTQTAGMGAAAYMLCLRLNASLDYPTIGTFVVGGTSGVLLGLAPALDANAAAVPIYMALYALFALVLLAVGPLSLDESAAASALWRLPRPQDPATAAALAHALMGVCAVAGGIVTAAVGSGLDLCLFTFGKCVWNSLMPPARRLSDRTLTASSVVAMAAVSAIASLARAVDVDGISQRSLHCWGAAAWLVCVLAPVGSLVFTERASRLQHHVRRVAIFLSVAQLGAFAIARPPPAAFWPVLGTLVALLLGAMLYGRRAEG